MISSKLLFVLLAGLVMIFPILEEDDWKLSLDKDDIIVFTRDVDKSSFKEFLAEATMNGTIEDFKRIITDIENYPDWLPDCKSVHIIEKLNSNDITYHMKLKVPFPFANRDIVQQIILNETEGKLEVMILNHPNKVKKEKKYVRMENSSGRWVIQQVSTKEIAIKFQYFADPGGDIPAWLVNSFVVKNPHKSLSNMRELMED
jgi:ribosome-associated toxin RatA of RatAB toxin-antitoxin module